MSDLVILALAVAAGLAVAGFVLWRLAERDAANAHRRADTETQRAIDAETKVRHLTERCEQLRRELDGADDRYWPTRWSDRVLQRIHTLPTTPDREYPR